MDTRRRFLTSSASVLGLGVASQMLPVAAQAASGRFEMEMTDAQWRAKLTKEQYAVLRQEATERAGTSPLNAEKRRGTYACIGCELPVYSSETKFDSGTGWPSFTAPIENAVGTKTDRKFFITRTEVHCRRCGGHLGHVFDDGPPPTGMRHCLNGVALKFTPAEA